MRVMIMHETGQSPIIYSIEKDKYYYKGKCIWIDYERDDGVFMGQIPIPLSVVTIIENSDGSIKITIPSWIYNKKIHSGFRLVGWRRFW